MRTPLACLAIVFVGITFCGCGSKSPAVPPSSKEDNVLEAKTVFRAGVRIPEDHLFLSPDGATVVYHHRDSKRLEDVLVIGKQAGKPYNYLDVPPLFGPRGKLIVYHADRDGKEYLVVNGEERGGYDHLAWPPTFSPDGTHMLVVAQRGEKFLAVQQSGAEGDEFDSVGDPIFSAEGNAFAYVAGRRDKQLVVVGDAPQAAFDAIRDLQFRPGGTEIAYVASDGGKTFVVVDGVPGKKYDRIECLHFQPGCPEVAYVANAGWNPLYQGGTWFPVVGVEEGDPFEGAAGDFLFDATGRCIAYTVKPREESGSHVVWNGKGGKEYDEVGGLVVSGDGSTIAYLAWSGREQFIVVGTEEGKHYAEGVSLPLASPQGATFVYRVEQPDPGTEGRTKQFVVVDGVEHRRYDRVEDLGFLADGKTVVYRANEGGEQGSRTVYRGSVGEDRYFYGGNWFFVVAGKEQQGYAEVGGGVIEEYSGHRVHGDPIHFGDKSYVITDADPTITSALGGPPLFSPAGTSYAYLARSPQGVCLVVNGQAENFYDDISSPVFSPRGDVVAYKAKKEGWWLVVVGGVEGERFGAVTAPVFTDSDTVTYYADRSETLYRVTRPLKSTGLPGGDSSQGN